MTAIRVIHIVLILIWLGNLLTLTRFMGYHVKESAEVQERLARLYKRMYYFVGMPCLYLGIFLGCFQIANINWEYKPYWFHLKMTAFAGLFVCDLICQRFIGQLSEKADLGRGVKYKVLHGMTGIFLILVVVSIFGMRDKIGEAQHAAAKSILTVDRN